MTITVGKRTSPLPAFDPGTGTKAIEAPGVGYGFWAGAPSIDYSRDDGYALYYRLRRPRSQGRGGECGIARSEDGDNFTSVWSCTKEDIGAKSIEKGAVVRLPNGRWRLYLSYEVAENYDRNPATWRVDMAEADSIDNLDPESFRTVLDPGQYGLGFIKDPTVSIVGGQTLLYASVGLPQSQMPRSSDFAPYPRGHAMLFTSHDGLQFSPGRLVMSRPEDAWDGRQQRITGVVHHGAGWWAFYDGARARFEAYDEFSGLAQGWQPDEFTSLTPHEPWVRSPHATGSVRYVDGVIVDNRLELYYEMASQEGHHDLYHASLDLTVG